MHLDSHNKTNCGLSSAIGGVGGSCDEGGGGGMGIQGYDQSYGDVVVGQEVYPVGHSEGGGAQL